nr:hypothetical protein [Tanacetum cinerariifolium]
MFEPQQVSATDEIEEPHQKAPKEKGKRKATVREPANAQRRLIKTEPLASDGLRLSKESDKVPGNGFLRAASSFFINRLHSSKGIWMSRCVGIETFVIVTDYGVLYVVDA